MSIAKSGKLRLDRTIVFREVGFYGLSILLLYVAVQDVREIPIGSEISDAEDMELEERIFISFGGSLMIFTGYIAYVLVCANMKSVVALFEKLPVYSALPPIEEEVNKEKDKVEAQETFGGEDLTIEMITTKYSDAIDGKPI